MGKKSDNNIDNNEIGTLWNTAHYRLYNCKHKTIKLGNYGTISGGSFEGSNISLYVYLDKMDIPKTLLDSYGKLKEGKQRIIYFPIDDGMIPQDYKMFSRIVAIAYDYLKRGKNIHVQCMSGHGRTGMFIACLIGRYMARHIPEKINLVDWIRKVYCKDAIEGYGQHKYVSDFTHTKQPDIKSYTKYGKVEKKDTWNYFWCPDCDKSGYTEIFMVVCPQCKSKHVESYDINSFQNMKEIKDVIE